MDTSELITLTLLILRHFKLSNLIPIINCHLFDIHIDKTHDYYTQPGHYML